MIVTVDITHDIEHEIDVEGEGKLHYEGSYINNDEDGRTKVLFEPAHNLDLTPM